MFAETLDAIKFICKDIWAACWDKQVITCEPTTEYVVKPISIHALIRHQGVYVLQDNSFKPITRLSSWESRADAMKRARLVRANKRLFYALNLRNFLLDSMLPCLQVSSAVHLHG